MVRPKDVQLEFETNIGRCIRSEGYPVSIYARVSTRPDICRMSLFPGDHELILSSMSEASRKSHRVSMRGVCKDRRTTRRKDQTNLPRHSASSPAVTAELRSGAIGSASDALSRASLGTRSAREFRVFSLTCEHLPDECFTS